MTQDEDREDWDETSRMQESVFDAQWCKPLQTSQVQSDLCKFEPRMRAWLTKLRVLDTTGLRKMCVRRGALSSTYPYWYWDCDSDLFRLSGGPCSRHDPCLVVPLLLATLLATILPDAADVHWIWGISLCSDGYAVLIERLSWRRRRALLLLYRRTSSSHCSRPVGKSCSSQWSATRVCRKEALRFAPLKGSQRRARRRSAENQRTELLPEIVVRDDVFTICHPFDHWPKGGAVRSDQEPSGLPWPRGESRTFTVQHF